MVHSLRFVWPWALLAWGIACATLRSQLMPPEVYVVNVVPLQAGIFEQRMQVDLRIRNPNDFDIALNGLDFQLSLNGSKLARGLSNEAVTVPRLGESIVSAVVTTTVLDLVRQVTAIGKGEAVTYEVHGRLHLNRYGTLPFDSSGNLGS